VMLMQNIKIQYPKPKTTEMTKRIVESTVRDKFFSVSFVKSDGSVRHMNGRLGVNKHLKGGINRNDATKYLTMYDTKSKGYRNVNLDTLESVTVDGITHEFVE